nr:hypothetical protein CFP56_31699 [Quercus suber]
MALIRPAYDLHMYVHGNVPVESTRAPMAVAELCLPGWLSMCCTRAYENLDEQGIFDGVKSSSDSFGIP